MSHVGIPPYKNPLILEDKRAKIEFTHPFRNGALVGTFLNKTDSDIYLVSEETTINGKHRIKKYENNGKNVIKANQKPGYVMNVHDYYLYVNGVLPYLVKPDSEDGPKVVKNKITFKRGDSIIKYKHNNKIYTLKLPARTETHDVYYANDSISTQHEQIRKEQLGY